MHTIGSRCKTDNGLPVFNSGVGQFFKFCFRSLKLGRKQGPAPNSIFAPKGEKALRL